MAATINVNNRTVVRATSGGVCTGFPDVCKTPTPGGPVPIPYPNIARSQDTAMGSATVAMDGNPIMLKGSCFAMSTGDEAGSAGGVVSAVIKGKAEFINYSFDVTVEGKNVCRLGDMMLLNNKNTPPAPLVQPPIVLLPSIAILPSESEASTKDWNVTALEFDDGKASADSKESRGVDANSGNSGQATDQGSTAESEDLAKEDAVDDSVEDAVYDEQIRLVDEATGEPIVDYPYVILIDDKIMARGTTDENGMTARVVSGATEAELTVLWGDDALGWA